MKKKLFILFAILFGIGIFILLWAFVIEPRLIIVRRIEINEPKLRDIKVAYVSDLHICEGDESFVNRWIHKLNAENPDIILLGGDYIVVDIFNKKSMNPEKISVLLKRLKAKYGIFMIMGNHDGFKRANLVLEKSLQDSNIILLQNKNTVLDIKGRKICIAGIGDYSSRQQNINRALKDVCEPVIVFTHSPDLFESIPDYVSFIFAGHTHGGQVAIPFYGPLAKPRHLLGNYIKGFYEESGKKMFVSSGIGNSHLNVRFNNIPEIIIAIFK